MGESELGVFPVPGEMGRFHVQSSGKSGLLYLVDLDELVNGWCGCPHFEFQVNSSLNPATECKHIRQARQFVALRGDQA